MDISNFTCCILLILQLKTTLYFYLPVLENLFVYLQVDNISNGHNNCAWFAWSFHLWSVLLYLLSHNMHLANSLKRPTMVDSQWKIAKY